MFNFNLKLKCWGASYETAVTSQVTQVDSVTVTVTVLHCHRVTHSGWHWQSRCQLEDLKLH